MSVQSFGGVSIFDSCNGTHVAVGFGVDEGAGVDVSSGIGGGVPVSLATGEISVGEGIAGVQAGRKHRIEITQIKTLESMLNSSWGQSVPVKLLGENANS